MEVIGGSKIAESELLLPMETPPPEKIEKYHEHHDEHIGSFGLPTAVCFTVNFIMGAGFLGVPWGFHTAGIGTGILTLLLSTMVCWTTAALLLEVMSQAEALTRARYRCEDTLPSVMKLSWRKFEVVELVDMFMGKKMRVIYLVCVSLYLYGTEWGYSSVFGNAFSSHTDPTFISEDEDKQYLFYVAIFSLFVIPLSLCDLREQVILQVCMSGMRGLIILIMVVSTSVALSGSSDDKPFGKYSEDSGDTVDVKYFFLGSGGISMPHFAQLFPIVVYSQLFHAGIPVLVQPIKEKTKLRRVFGITYAITTTVYILSSTLLVIYFKGQVQDSCNVNWSEYTGTTFHTILSYIVVLFPAFDVLSVTPMNTIALASNLMSAYYGDRVAKMEKKRLVVSLFRLIAVVPPLVGSCFVRHLSTVLDYTGIVGLVIAFIMPCLLWLMSRRSLSKEFNIPVDSLPPTIFTSIYSDSRVVLCLLGLGCFILVFVFLGLVGALG